MIGKMIEFTDYISPDGKVYRFDNNYDKFVVSHEGEGMPPIDYITQRGPMQHGESIIDYRLRPRTIQYVHKVNACDRVGYWEARATLLDILRPNRYSPLQKGILRKRIPGVGTRQIDVVIVQGPVFNARSTSQWMENTLSETLRFIAHDPIFYDPVQQTQSWVLSSGDHLVFEANGVGTEDLIFAKDGVGVGLIFSLGIINNSISIAYPGTWLTYPTITINGPALGIIVRNDITDETIRYNRNILDGEVVTLDLAYGRKTATSNINGNVIGSITSDSDIATFHIAPAEEAPGGVNTLSVVGTNVTANTNISICWYNRYIGI